VLIEIIGEVAKVASLSFRLFGNVFAGEVLLAAMSSIFAYATPIPFLFLEILVGAIQALIFAILTMVYFTIASQDHDHDNNEEDIQYEINNELIQESIVDDGVIVR
jgi:F-type H+-transporting ATPase subunit a